ncbi:MAG: FAD-dependent monooxygenase [Acidimicrobiales bacterium]
MKTLIIGAGMAGLTLSGYLCQQGRPPVIIERSTAAEGGYALGLYPLGSCVLHGLRTYETLVGEA